MPYFNQYAGLDYSGARSRAAQRRHIVLALAANTSGRIRVITGKDRNEMRIYLLHLFRRASRLNRRVLLGIDHNFSFPQGFYEMLTGHPLDDWRQWLDLIKKGPLSLSAAREDPRTWAELINEIVKTRLAADSGPFWGPGFSVLKHPAADHSRPLLREKRLIEELIPRTQSVFKLGGAGAVGLQSLYGIHQLALLNEELQGDGIELFFWPFDGFIPPSDRHVVLELYPGIINKGTKSDRNDTVACVRWLKDADSKGDLSGYFHHPVPDHMYGRIREEGWIPGITF